ncbi:MAG: hypothetical protein ABIO55_00700 [Ginsengibacter sp.]
MENLNPNRKSSSLPDSNKHKMSQCSSRGFISVDQEMEREIALSFFDPSKKSFFSQKSFFLVKH